MVRKEHSKGFQEFQVLFSGVSRICRDVPGNFGGELKRFQEHEFHVHSGGFRGLSRRSM